SPVVGSASSAPPQASPRAPASPRARAVDGSTAAGGTAHATITSRGAGTAGRRRCVQLRASQPAWPTVRAVADRGAGGEADAKRGVASAHSASPPGPRLRDAGRTGRDAGDWTAQ